MRTEIKRNRFKTFGLLFYLAISSPAFALEFFEDFNGAGVPPVHAGGYWYKMNEIYPSQSSWNDYMPGDGHVYITVDNSSSWGDYQGVGVGWIPLSGQRMEVRMKGAIQPGYVGFIFTYASSADEIDIELLADDTQGEGGVHDPYAWSDARFNSTINGNNWNSNFQGIVDETGSKVSHYEDDTYHTYTIDHFGDKIVFYIDGVYQETTTWSIPADQSEIILGFRGLDFAGSTNWSGLRTLTIDWLNVKEIDSSSPVAAADRYTTDQNTLINISGSGILANDTGSNLVTDLVSDVEHGTLSLNAGGSFTYMPDTGFVGEDHFVYFANDGTSKGESNAARVLLRVGQPVEWQKVDNTNANITYDSNWGTWEGNPGYLSTEHFSETAGSEATFTFTGNQARYYGFKRNNLGFAEILVDGVVVTTLDLYSASALYDNLLYETEILPWGEHTITIRVKGTQNSSSSGYEVIIDAFSWIDNGPVITAPVANFISSVSDLTVDFSDTSTDDGNIVSWNWDFGDGNTSTSQNPTHTYTAENTYTVSLTVTDNDGETNSTSRSVTVLEQLNSPPNPNPMTWSVEPYKDPAWPTYIVGTMTASVATDADGGIEYFFDCIEAPDGGGWNGGEDSGWQASNTFSDWYLLDGYTYTYRVKARDALGNETNWSAVAAITIGDGNSSPTASISYGCTYLL